MKFSILNQKSSQYNPKLWEKIRLLYTGGEEIIANANQFMPKIAYETTTAYQQRLREASYVNYFSSIVDRFASDLFSKELALVPAADSTDQSTPGDQPRDNFYSTFAANADLKNNKLATVLKDIFLDGVIYGKGFIGLDFPSSDYQPTSLAEEEALGTDRAYAFKIPIDEVLDYEKDSQGNFTWCILKREFQTRSSPTDARDTKTIQFKVWTKSNSQVSWQLFETKCKLNEEPRNTDEVPLVSEGTVSFRQIPIIELDMPEGLWIGNKIGTLCADHFRLLSSLRHAENRSLHAVPYYKKGPEIDASGDMSDTKADPNRHLSVAATFASKGFLVIAADEELGFLEPSGKAYEIANTQMKELVDEIHRITHQLASSVTNTSKALGRSGMSKMQDNKATEVVLDCYGSLVKDFAKKIYQSISEARQERIVWQALGLDSYETLDKEEIINEAVSAAQINIQSPTFKKLHQYKLAIAFLPNASPETLLTIKEEIDESIDELEAHANTLDAMDPNEEPELTKEPIAPTDTEKPVPDESK
jgi:hypothetical protein